MSNHRTTQNRVAQACDVIFKERAPRPERHMVLHTVGSAERARGFLHNN